MIFSHDYPNIPPDCKFIPALFHPNVFPSGKLCSSLLGDKWQPSVIIPEILLHVQSTLYQPDLEYIAQVEAYTLFALDHIEYQIRIRSQVLAMPVQHDAKR